MSPQKKTVAFFLVDLYRGGGERVVVDLMRGFLEEDYRVDLILMRKEGPYLEQVPAEVNIITCDTNRMLGLLPKLVAYLKKERPRALIAITRHLHLVSVWAKMIARVSTKIIMRVGIPYTVLNTKSNVKERSLPFLSKIFYRRADAVVAVSEHLAEDLQERLHVPEERMHVIHNPKFLEEIKKKTEASVHEPWLVNKDIPVVVAMGRLAPQKGFDLLIQACATVSKNTPVRLLILGEGGEKENLIRLAKSTGIEESVKIVPFQQNPYTFLSRADVFVLSSRWEGMPNALIEAMACGAPVIAADCVSGPKEILGEDSTYGLLIKPEDSGVLASALERMLTDDSLREEYRKKARMRAEDFSHKKIITQYVALIEAT